MHCRPLRLTPGEDLRAALEASARAGEGMSAFVLSGIGSLANAKIRLADADAEMLVPGSVEILCISGTLTPDGAHLHMAVSDAGGRVIGGHVGYGNVVRTTAEILVVQLSDWRLGREPDPATGYMELVIRPTGRP